MDLLKLDFVICGSSVKQVWPPLIYIVAGHEPKQKKEGEKMTEDTSEKSDQGDIREGDYLLIGKKKSSDYLCVTKMCVYRVGVVRVSWSFSFSNKIEHRRWPLNSTEQIFQSWNLHPSVIKIQDG